MRSKPHRGWLIVAMSTLVVFAALGLARFGYSTVLPAMQAGLAMRNTGAGALATANLAGYLLLAAAGGALAARFGPRIVIALGLAVAGFGMLLTGTATTFAQAALWRTLTGAGSGASNVPVMGLISSWFAPRRRGFAAGIAVSGSSIAMIATGAVVPRILAAPGPSGWRACWMVFGATTLALAAAAYAILRNRPSELNLAPVGSAAGEAVTAAPAGSLRWRDVYRSRAVWHLGLVYVAFGFAYIIYMTFFVKRLVSEGGYTAAEAGRLFMFMGWFSLLCGVVWGTVSDRIGRRHALVLVYLIQATAFVLFASTGSRPVLTLSAALFGVTAWSIPAIMAAACGDILGARMAPAALGFITLFFGAGQALGPTVAGAIADQAGSFAPAFQLAAGVSILGALGAATLRPPPRQE